MIPLCASYIAIIGLFSNPTTTPSEYAAITVGVSFKSAGMLAELMILFLR